MAAALCHPGLFAPAQAAFACSAPSPELLGHHLLAAVRLQSQTGAADAALANRAYEALAGAGDRALSLSAYTAATNHYKAALEFADEGDSLQTAHLLLGVGKAFFHTGTTLPSELERAAGMFERLGDVQQAADAEAFWAAWLVNHNIAGEALVHAKRASALLEDQPDSSEKAYAVMAVGRIESALDDPECWESLVAGAAIAERIGSLELRIRAKLTLGEERLCRDDPAGVQEVEEALRLARGQTSSIASLCKMCSVGDLLALGRITESRTVLNEGLEEAAELQLETIRQGLEAQFVSLAFTAGDWNTTHPITEAARARAQLGADAGSQQPLGAEVAIAIRAVVDLSDGRTIGECQ